LTPAWFQLVRVVVHHAGVGPLLDLIDCGDIVEPFLGSGSTLIAADKTGRVCRGVEFDRSTSMWSCGTFEAATGNQAVLVETGQTFEALATQGAGTDVGRRPAPAVADEEREAAAASGAWCPHCEGQRFESPPVHQPVLTNSGGTRISRNRRDFKVLAAPRAVCSRDLAHLHRFSGWIRPAAIGAIAFQNKAVVYDLLFKTAAEALTTIAADPKHLGARSLGRVAGAIRMCARAR
jgi:hypothetical protein